MEDWVGTGEWIQAAEPTRDAVIVELIDGGYLIHVECKNPENHEALQFSAQAILRYVQLHPNLPAA
jgi:hypothetical protein